MTGLSKWIKSDASGESILNRRKVVRLSSLLVTTSQKADRWMHRRDLSGARFALVVGDVS